MPEDTPQENRCPQCSKPLPPGSPRGLCPACLFKRGLEPNTVGYTADQPAAKWTPPTVEQLSPLFPELEVLGLIGRGGMGAVYKARQKELDRLVALKILPPEIGSDPSFAQRFAREAQAMAKLSHPNIVSIHDFGKNGDYYFFLMEYVDGLSLRQLLDAGTVSPKEALAIVPQICDALQYAHDRGIVHRDIKPENILLNRAGQVKIADFGLAKLVGTVAQPFQAVHEQAGKPVPPAETIAGERVLGTPQYMAPEQVERPGEVDHRADIYSLGVVFYQMLTGELPSAALAKEGRFEPPSRKVLIDVRLDEVVLRALEKEPDRRYQQVSEVKTQVETIVATGGASRAGAEPIGRATKPGIGGVHAEKPSPNPPDTDSLNSLHDSGSRLYREIHDLKFRLMLIPMLIILVVLVLLFLRDHLPWREVSWIWLPWLGIMLAVAAGAFAGFRATGRSKSMLLRLGAGVGFLCLAIFVAYSVWPFGGDSLSVVPIAIQIIFFIIYGVLLVILAASSRGPTKVDDKTPNLPKRLSKLALASALGLPTAIVVAVVLDLLYYALTPDVRQGAQVSGLGALTGIAIVISGIVMGIAALIAIHNSHRRLTGRGLAIFGIAAPSVILIVGVSLLFTRSSSIRSSSQQLGAMMPAISVEASSLTTAPAWTNPEEGMEHFAYVRGQVTDSSTGLPIRGAMVLDDFESSSDQPLEARTDGSGSFSLRVRRREHDLSFMAAGYRTEVAMMHLTDHGDPITMLIALKPLGLASQPATSAAGEWSGEFGTLPGEVTAYVVDRHMEAYAKAKEKGIFANSQVYTVTADSNRRMGGLITFENVGDKPMAGEIPIAVFDGNDLIFEDVSIGKAKVRMAERDTNSKSGRYQALWTPDKPIPPGAFHILCWISPRPHPLPNDANGTRLKMSNFPGAVLTLENFFLIVPKGVGVVDPSSKWNGLKRIGDFDVYQWQDEVRPNTNHEVDATLKVNPPSTITASQPATKTGEIHPATAKVFHSAAEVIAGLPTDAQPDPRDGWDEFSSPKADKWLEDNISKQGFEVALDAVVKGVELTRIFPKDQPNQTVRWDVALALERIPLEFNGRKLTLKLDSFTPFNPNARYMDLHLGTATVTISGDESFARRAKALQAGDKLTIRGTISKASTWEKNPPELWILLSDPAVVLPSNTAPTATTSVQPAATKPAATQPTTPAGSVVKTPSP